MLGSVSLVRGYSFSADDPRDALRCARSVDLLVQDSRWMTRDPG